ncbi:MAG: SBBP repeat-containing protein [Deltaproteobacteria bacterium]|nr:SBBP repeat-containing protein [Deltaproteobacteria bacterium]
MRHALFFLIALLPACSGSSSGKDDAGTGSDTGSDSDGDTDSDGEWWHTFYGSSGYDSSKSLAVDQSGNLYVTGYSNASWNGPSGEGPLHPFSGGNDIFILKLSSSGTYEWHTFYGSVGDDSGLSLAVDGNGNLYVKGYSEASWNGPSGESPLNIFSDSSGYFDIFVLKLSSSGAYKWHAFFETGDNNLCDSLAIDGRGDLYLTGFSAVSWTGPSGQSPLHAFSGLIDILVLKLDSNGAYQWHTFFGSEAGDYGNSIAVDQSGDLYVTGESWLSWNGPAGENPLHAISENMDIFVLKLSSSGAYQWHAFYGSDMEENVQSIAVDGKKNLYVTGFSNASWNGPGGESPLHVFSDASGTMDVYILKLSSSGAYEWHTFYGSGSDSGSSLALDGSGDLYVTGDSKISWAGPNGESPLNAFSGYWDIMVLKLDSNGSYKRHALYGSDNQDNGISIAVDGKGSVYVAGESWSSWNGPHGESPLHAYQGSGDIVVLKTKL